MKAQSQALSVKARSERCVVSQRGPGTGWRHRSYIEASAHRHGRPAILAQTLRHSSEMRSCLQLIARAKHALPQPATISIFEGNMAISNSDSAVNHQGTQIIMRKGDDITVSQLHLDQSPIALSTVFKKTPVEAINEADDVETADVSFTWSPDDDNVAIRFIISNRDDPRAEFNENGYFDVLYNLSIGAQSLQEVLICSAQPLPPARQSSDRGRGAPGGSLEPAQPYILEIKGLEGKHGRSGVLA
ncbi:hypothetical protein WJX73_000149 [Symbiochloris irregularis]|uniref:Uncharacterized protein n=1 Tax=Symbiochloris irregularis TaxID=706552 RepID=A0AAW1NQF8_9CHLO